VAKPNQYAIGAKWQNNGTADYLQLVSPGGTVIGWIDENGVLQGTLTNASTSVTTNSSLTGNGTSSSPLSVVSNNVVQATQYGVLANVKVSYQAAWTSSSTTVTASDGNFTSADVGKIIFGTNSAPTGATSFLTSVVKLPQGTIVSVTNSTTVVVSVAATATVTSGNGILLWGNDDTTALTSAWTAVTAAAGGVLQLPAGKMFIQSAIFINVSTANLTGSGTGGNYLTISGQGLATQIIPTPNFSFSSCTGPDGTGTAAFGWGSLSTQTYGGLIFKDWSIQGYGQSLTGATHSNIMVYAPSDSYFINFACQGFGAGCTSLIGMQIGGYNAVLVNVELDHFGSTVLYVNMNNTVTSTLMTGCYVGGGQTVSLNLASGILQSSSNLIGNNQGSSAEAVLVSGGTWLSSSDAIRPATTYGIKSTGGVIRLNNFSIPTGYNAVGTAALLVAGGNVTVSDSLISNAGGAGYSVQVTSGTFVNLGGNTFTGGYNTSGGTAYAQSGGEGGRATASSNSITVVFNNTYAVTPIIVVSDETTAGGATVTSKSATGCTITTTGASDVVDWTVVPNPI